MFKRSIVALLTAFIFAWMPLASYAAMRTYNSPVRPWRRLALQFASNSNVFTTSDPSPAGANLPVTSCTGRSTGDGSVTIGLQAGFTAPITFTVYYWQIDSATPANSCWVRLGPVASGGQSNYTQTVDTNYASFMFAIPENTTFLIRSSTAVTGNVYTDSFADNVNPNSAAGFTDAP